MHDLIVEFQLTSSAAAHGKTNQKHTGQCQRCFVGFGVWTVMDRLIFIWKHCLLSYMPNQIIFHCEGKVFGTKEWSVQCWMLGHPWCRCLDSSPLHCGALAILELTEIHLPPKCLKAPPLHLPINKLLCSSVWTQSHYVPADDLDVPASLLLLLNAGIIGVNHHTWFPIF